MIKILHISPDFNYACGRSKYVFLFLKYFQDNGDYETHFITNGGDSLERLKATPRVKFRQLKFTRGIKNIFYGKSFYNLLKDYIVKHKINIIHTHHRFPELVSVNIGKELKIKTITSTHSFVRGFKRISFKSDKIISVSNAVTNYLIENYSVSSEKIITIYNPVEEFLSLNYEDGNILKKKLSIEPHYKVLLFPGRISFEKGTDTLLNSFMLLNAGREDVLLIICGSIEHKSLQNKIKNQSNVILLEPQKNIIPLFSAADIVILPSRIEPFPFVMLEAGIFKKPFIGGNTGGIAEFIEDGINGLLVDPENPQHLAEKINFLLENEDFAKKLGENLHIKVKEKCDYNNYFNKIEEIYNSLV